MSSAIFTSNNSRDLQVHRLGKLIERVQKSRVSSEKRRVSTGCPPLDRLLPDRGITTGSLIEWIGTPGGGATAMSLLAAREACHQGGALVVIDRSGTFYPPAVAAWQIDLARMILVRPTNEQDEQWALDQVLRCRHVAAVLAWPRRIESRTFRRLQLAAESSGGLGLLVRPLAARSEPSWSSLRLQIAPCSLAPSQRNHRSRTGAPVASSSVGWVATQPNPLPQGQGNKHAWQLEAEVLRAHGRFAEGKVQFQIDDRTGEIHEADSGDLVSQLADQPARSHSA